MMICIIFHNDDHRVNLSRQLICGNCHKIDGIIQNNDKMYRIVDNNEN